MSPDSPANTSNAFSTFGDLLKYLRRRARLTQLELSIAVGYSEGQISRLEKNLRLPDLTAIKALFVPALHIEGEPHLTTRLLELAESARQEDAPIPGLAPYKGLLFFDESDSELFFGRETLTAQLAEHVMDLAMDASSRFLAIVGASGSGKSSLVRAGLAVALKRAGWVTHVFTPTAHPLKMLEVNLNLARRTGADQILLLVDQFEEAFTLCRDEIERITFFEKLLTCAQDKSMKATVVTALRADFYSHCAQYPLLRKAVAAQQEYIGQMTFEELRRAIEEPARRGGWEFEPGLVEVLLQDLATHGSHEPEPGALPLLSHALLATWEHRRGRTFTLEGYRASGGIRGAIAETAESVFTDQLNQTQQELARDVFLRLTELGEGTEDTRRRAALNELVRQSAEAPQLRAVLNTLAEARLITLNEDSAEVAHEALIREWQRLHEWLTQDREGLLLHRHLTESAQAWEARNRDPSELYRGARLAQAREWASTNAERLNTPERAFIVASIEQEEHDALEQEAQRQRELEAAHKLAETQSRAARQLRHRAIFLTGAFALAIVLAGIAVFLGNQANRNARAAQENALSAEKNAEEADTNAQQAMAEQRIAISRELAAAAISNLNDDPERSILLALQAEESAGTIEAQNALHRSILESRVQLVLHHDAEVWSVTFSPDGRRIATASQDKTARIWDATTGQLLVTLTGHTKSVNGVAFSPDGTRLATGSDDQTAIIWDAATGDELLILRGHTNWVLRLAFSPDGTLLATASQDGTAKIWDTRTGELLHTFFGHRDSVFDVAFNPDGQRVATGGMDGNVRVWEASSGKELLSLPIEGGVSGFAPGGVAFSQDGMRVAVAENGSQAVEVWNAVTGEILLRKDQFPAQADDIAFSPDGKLAATGSLNSKPEVWDAATGKVLYTLSGHLDTVNGIAFSPDGTRLATASWDHTARVWNITPSTESLYIPLNLPMPLPISYSPDGTRIITHYMEDGSEGSHILKLWDTSSGKELLKLAGDSSETHLGVFFSYSPDEKMVAGSSGKAVIVWDAQNGEQLFNLSGHTDVVFRIAFNPTGTRLASGSDNGEIIIWDVASGKELFKVQGPAAGSSPSGSDQGIYGISSLAYSPNGKHLLSGDTGGFAIIWDAATGEKLRTISDQQGISGDAYFPEAISDAAYSMDGKYLALASHRGSTRILDANSGKELLDLKGHTTTVVVVAFSPDGKLIATASLDGTVRLWDATTGVNLLTLPLLGGISFSPDGKRLAVGTESGVQVFVLPIDELVALAKSRVTRSLTTEECQQYLHVATCPADP